MLRTRTSVGVGAALMGLDDDDVISTGILDGLDALVGVDIGRYWSSECDLPLFVGGVMGMYC